MYTIKETLKQGSEKLKNVQDKPIFMCRLILQCILNKTKEYLLIHEDDNLTKEEYTKFMVCIEKLNKGMPLQYITNKQEFMKLDFYVDENVLIPQPDTEILVEKVLELIQDKKQAILDLCTGSGAIAISLSKYSKNCKIYGTDISKEALEIAKANNAKNNANVEFVLSDMFEKLENRKFDIIVSNPPYIKTEDIKSLNEEVKNEPHLALDGGKDGLDFYRVIVNEGYKYLNENGYICIEIGYDQKDEVVELIKNSGNYTGIKCFKDLGGNDRVIIFQRY